MDGHILRLACAPFGVQTSNGPLALLVDGFYSILRRVNPAVERGGFVDDLWFYLTMSEHGECKGLAGGCVHCWAALARGRSHEEFVDALLQELHLERSDKDGALGQEGVFLGAVLNTNTGRMGLTEKKYAKLLNDLRAVMTWDSATPRLASNVRGKLQAYADCLEGVRPFAIPFTLFI